MPPHSRGLTSTTIYHFLRGPAATPFRTRFVCYQCAFRGQTQRLPSISIHRFSTTSPLSKKTTASKKSARKSPDIQPPSVDRHIPNNAATRNRDAEPDPYDHSLLQSQIDTAITRLKENLTKTRDAGRVSPAMLEDLPVELNVKGSSTQGGAAHKEHLKVRDLANVIPKGGRTLQILVSSESDLKPVANAVAASPYSLTPQTPTANANNPLMIEVPIPPVTAETRQQAAAEAKKVFDQAGLEVRNARGEAQKRHRKMELQKLVVPDELKKAHRGMEEVVKKGQEEVKKVFENAVRALER